MTLDAFNAAYYTKPFRPFVLRLPDGRGIPVPHPEFVMKIPNVKTIVVGKADPLGSPPAPEGKFGFNIVDLETVSDLEFDRLEPTATNNNKTE